MCIIVMQKLWIVFCFLRIASGKQHELKVVFLTDGTTFWQELRCTTQYNRRKQWGKSSELTEYGVSFGRLYLDDWCLVIYYISIFRHPLWSLGINLDCCWCHLTWCDGSFGNNVAISKLISLPSVSCHKHMKKLQLTDMFTSLPHIFYWFLKCWGVQSEHHH